MSVANSETTTKAPKTILAEASKSPHSPDYPLADKASRDGDKFGLITGLKLTHSVNNLLYNNATWHYDDDTVYACQVALL